MKRFLALGPLICGLVFTCSLNAQATQSATRANGESAQAEELSPALILNQPTRGVVFKTAAINGNGSVASCFRCTAASTVHLGTGQYQVSFDENVQAVNGWSRFVQVDTLGIGSANAWCTTADRFLVPNAIWVSCQAPGGSGSQGNSKPVDTSFFIFVAR